MPDRSPDRSTYLPLKDQNGKGVSHKNGNSTYSYSFPVSKVAEAEGDSIDLRQLFSMVKHRLRLISAVVAGVTITTAIITLNQKAKYQGSFQLLVEPVAKEQEDPLAALQPDLGGLDYDTQIEVLRSPRVLNPIIKELVAKYAEINYEELIKPKRSPLKIEQLDETKILEVSFIDHDPEKIQFVLDKLAAAYLSYSLDDKRAKAKQGIDFVESQLPGVRARVNQLQGKLQTFRQQYNLLDPEKQAQILAQQRVNFELKYFDTQAQLKETRSSYSLLQKQLNLNPQQALAASYLSESPRYQNLLNELQKIEIDLAQESSRFSAANPVIQNLQEKRTRLLALLQQEAGGVLGQNLAGSVDNSSNLTSPSSLRLKLNQEYIDSANKIEILQLRERVLQDEIAKLNDLTKQMPVIARQYTDLNRQLVVATESLNRFLTAKEELQLQVAQQALPWQTISPPKVWLDPVSPKIPQNIALGLLSGLMLGCAAALFAERLDPVFHSPEELKQSINLPLLGLIPVQKDLHPADEADELATAPKKEKISLPQLQIGNTILNLNRSINSTPTNPLDNRQKWNISSPFLESFRSLNTNIKLLGSDTSLRSFVISSSIPSEGKSTVSSHLAQAAATMGQRVMLIDADLRRPQVHRWLGIENQQGLSNVLATGLDVEEAIIKVPQWDNLSVITAGDIPPDPTRLLSSQKMFALMERLKSSRQYDLIIYDTPPILGFADGRILSNRTDGIVLVVRIGKTDRSLLKQNIENIQMSNVPVLGVIANHVNHTTNSYHYYSHYYADRK
ncbi:protein tyrosine kinase [Pleurocapsa sp. CCALA 161]|uniref:GumC family protein n=1 Tax=Pleurocapsa sp. CCALA 161 TaxID=2107688 RepID=UPI000D0820BB|nr:polysaccharide biosynthesis tyrosine autokinase [Pleurocapsa sp. CCALA 161]PSB07640.1 protein tyrosine kinase [Pleurocapsa sp. CCALA 161]